MPSASYRRSEMPPRFEPASSLGAGVAEIKTNEGGETYRALHIVKFPEGVYVLDPILKKSKLGKQLPQQSACRIRAQYQDIMAERKDMDF